VEPDRSALDTSDFVDELSDALVARPVQAEPGGLRPKATIRLGDRDRTIVEADECFEEPV
jgi:hypothetical protein